jgi:ParB family chromosome partitioning protein
MSLDLAEAGWVPTVENYLGRVTKARILEAVREAKGERAVQRIEGLKKDAMAEAAAQVLMGTGWLPEPLRTKGVVTCVTPRDDDAGTIDEHGSAESPSLDCSKEAQDSAITDNAALAAE